MTSSSVRQDARFTSLDDSSQNIIRTLLKSRKALQGEIEAHFNALNISVEEEHAKTRTALKSQAEEHYQRRAELHILVSLSFENMTHRHDDIPEAHRLTFEWIFDTSDAVKPWSNFCTWLENGNGVYWINGKAGCGKSTLMKFIIDDPRTRTHLGQWAPSDALEIPAFFFWNSGSSEQRSQAGLFRSILHDILQSHTNLIPTVFPEEWQKALELSRHEVQADPEKWSLSRLQKAFKRLVGCASKTLSYCFFIDGLDEYEGDHEEISDYFSELSKLPFIKFCIASRPLIVFKDAFCDSPSLRLQNLTSGDIAKYVEDKLNGHKRIRLLAKQNPTQVRELVGTVIYKAEGVFLWVTLVVTSLLKGCSQRDGFPQLLKRLNTFPSDLNQLYEHMLSSIDPIYMEEGSRIFQIYCASERYNNASVELIYVALIADLQRVIGPSKLDLQKAMEEPVEIKDISLYSGGHGYSIYNFESLYEYMDDKVRTHCGGLIECNKYTSRSNKTIKAYLSYIHQTVKDYLAREDIWTDLCGHTANNPDFNPYLQLLMSHVLNFKRVLLFKGIPAGKIKKTIHYKWNATCGHLWSIHLRDFDLNIECLLLDEFNKSASSLIIRADTLSPFETSLHWTNSSLPPSWKTNFLCEAVRQCIPSYVTHHAITSIALGKRKSGLPLLAFTFMAKWIGLFTNGLDLIEILLKQGENPNEIYEGYTIWQYFIHSLHSRLPSKKGNALHPYYRADLKRRVRLLLESGVDLDVCCIKESQAWRKIYNSPYKLERGLRLLRDSHIKHTSLENESSRRDSISSRISISTYSSSDSLYPHHSGLMNLFKEHTALEMAGRLEEVSQDGDGPEAQITLIDEDDVWSHDEAVNFTDDEEAAEEPNEEDPLFEEHHSLTTIFKEFFETDDDPHGADELLELIAKLKEAKGAKINPAPSQEET